MEILRVIFCIQAGVTISLSVGLIIGGISSGKFGILNLLVKSTVLNKFGKIFSIILYVLISPFWAIVDTLWLTMTYKKDNVKCNNCRESFCAKTAEKVPAIMGVAKCPHCGEFNVIDKGETK